MEQNVEGMSVSPNDSKPSVKRIAVNVKCDDTRINLSKGFIDAIKELMRQNILQMRKKYPESVDCWVIGVCEVTDIMSSVPLSFSYGGREDKGWLQEHGQIMVEVA